MPGASDAFETLFQLRYPVLFTAFNVTETGDGLGSKNKLTTDTVSLDVVGRLYFQVVSLFGGAVYVDGNVTHDIVDFTLDLWSHIGDPPFEALWFGGFLQPPGTLLTMIDPILDPWWWLDADLLNTSDTVRGFVEEPHYSIESERPGGGSIMHCQIKTVLHVQVP